MGSRSSSPVTSAAFLTGGRKRIEQRKRLKWRGASSGS